MSALNLFLSHYTDISPVSNEQSDCMRDLYLSDPGAAKERVPPRVQGTCSWLSTHHSYMEWLDSDGPRMLWVTGAPGSGKTVLSTFVIDEIRNKGCPPLLCFFFSDDKYALQKSAVALLRGVLYQLLLQNQDLVKHALIHWNITAGKTFEELSVLWKICTACFDDPCLGDVICVLDALDECEAQDRGQLLTWLTQFIGNHPPGSTNIKFFLTSRPEIGIADILEDSAIRIRLEIHEDRDWLSNDIEDFISHEISALPVLRKWQHARKEQLRSRLIKNADRTFLWVSLVLQKLPFESQMSETGLAMMLSQVPDRLEDIYREILSQTSNEQLAFYVGNLYAGRSLITNVARRNSLKPSWSNVDWFTSPPRIFFYQNPSGTQPLSQKRHGSISTRQKQPK